MTAVSPEAVGADAPAAEELALLDERFAERSVDTPEGPLSFREAGSVDVGGTAVVLLHGIGSGAGSWLHPAVLLAGTTRVVAWDAPGYGRSAPLAQAAPGAPDYAARLHRLLMALGIERCILVGHSLGALMAGAYAAGSGRQCVERLVLLSPARGYGGPAMAERQPVVRSQRLAALDELGIEGMARKRADKMLSSRPTAAALAWVRWNMARLDPAGYRQAVEMLCLDDIGRYARLSIPVEVHSGDEDGVTPPAGCRAIADLFDAAYAPIPGAGHACHIERPEAVAAIIQNARAARPA